jgi:hypothetical protein
MTKAVVRTPKELNLNNSGIYSGVYQKENSRLAV